MTAPEENPAALLRRAAEKLHNLATEATSGPWRREDHAPTLNRLVVSENELLYVNLGYVGNNSQRDAEYIASMHPAVGLALAAWLGAEAAIWDAVLTTKTEMGPKGLKVSFGLSTQEQALAVARAVLAEEAQQP